jgi:hypothetical protein
LDGEVDGRNVLGVRFLDFGWFFLVHEEIVGLEILFFCGDIPHQLEIAIVTQILPLDYMLGLHDATGLGVDRGEVDVLLLHRPEVHGLVDLAGRQ